MTDLNKAITQASKLIIAAIEDQSPETDCRTLPRKLHELVSTTVSAQNSSAVTITASEIAPKLCVAADGLACAHSMYLAGDKTNALRMAMFAFEQPDCIALMTSLSELNEETDPSDLDVVLSRVNKGEDDDSEITDDHDDNNVDNQVYGDPVDPVSVAPADASNDALVGNPAAEIDSMQDQDLTDKGAEAPYADYATYDFLNQGMPPDSIQVLKNVLSGVFDEDAFKDPNDLVIADGNMINLDEDLGDEDYGSSDLDDISFPNNYVLSDAVDDMVPSMDDNQLSNITTDPAEGVDWNPANWDLNNDMPTRSDPMNMDFDDMAAVNPGMTDLNGIDNTVSGNPKNESDTAALDSQMGLIPTLNPSQSIIAKITDPRIRAAINILSSKNDEATKAKLNAFINIYCLRHNITA
jgi:hypothetical protein